MYFKIKEQQKPHTLEAVKAYLYYLENNQYCPDYTSSIRFTLNKLHREIDWSYLFWPIYSKNEVARIVVKESTSGEFPRNSQWTLFNNGLLKLNALFKNKSLNLYDLISDIRLLKTEYPLKKGQGVLTELITTQRDSLHLCTTEEAFKILERICTTVKGEDFAKRTAPTLAILDSIQFFLETKLPEKPIANLLINLRNTIIETYNIRPLFVRLKTKEHNTNSDNINITLKEESLKLIIEALQHYCEIVDKFRDPSIKITDPMGNDKNSRLKQLLNNLKSSIEKI